MYPIYRSDILIISRLLLTRLTRPTTVSIDIIDNHWLCENPSANSIRTNIRGSFSRFVGCFDVLPKQDICFILAARADPDGDLSHIFVYHWNCDYKVIQECEINTLKLYVSELSNYANVKIGIINVKCSLDYDISLSVFIEAISHSIGSHLIEKFTPLQIINVTADYSRCFPSGISDRVSDTNNCRLKADLLDDFKKITAHFGVDLPVSLNYKKLIYPAVGILIS